MKIVITLLLFVVSNVLVPANAATANVKNTGNDDADETRRSGQGGVVQRNLLGLGDIFHSATNFLRGGKCNPTPAPTPAPAPAFPCLPDRVTLDAAVVDDTSITTAEATYGPIKNWCFDPGLTNFSDLFRLNSSFNRDISGWKTGMVVDMAGMFFLASAFNQNIGSWDVGKVLNMNSMFASTTAFNQDISGWDVAMVTDMSGMFRIALAFNQNIESWKIGMVTNMARMFDSASAFDQNLCQWYTTAAATPPAVSDMFSGAAMCDSQADPDFGLTQAFFCDACP